MPNKGSVKWFSNVKGYGFLETEDGNEVFVHYTEIQSDGYRKLEEGEEVEFDTIEGDRGLCATHVVKKTSPVSREVEEPVVVEG